MRIEKSLSLSHSTLSLSLSLSLSLDLSLSRLCSCVVKLSVNSFLLLPHIISKKKRERGMRKRERERGEEKREGETRTQSYVHRKKKVAAAGDDWRSIISHTKIIITYAYMKIRYYYYFRIWKDEVERQRRGFFFVIFTQIS